MAKSQVKSREAKVDLDRDVLEGEKAKTPNNLTRNEIIDISFSARKTLSAMLFIVFTLCLLFLKILP